jgi:asparagine synthase (glutamine-hydrolysing)
MCGIVAVLAPDGGLVPEPVEAALRALRHRGPDGCGRWISPSGRCALGHARLSIIDLATGQQPIASEDGRFQIVVNGELYGYQPVREELMARGHRLRTAGDSEIALHLFEESGPACLDRLRGEFALVIWDEREQRLFAARDRFGVKPLFYARHGGALYLASEIKALLAAGVPAAWDRESVHHLLTLGVPLPARTLFSGIRQVPPGHYLEAHGSDVRLVRWWDLDYPPADGGAAWGEAEDADAAQRLLAALDESVRLRLRADVPVGCYLSGGVDSSAVLGLAARHAGRLKAFTVAFDQDGYDESPLAEESARRAGAEWCPIRVGQAELARRFEESVWHTETACKNAHGVAKFILSEHVRESGFKVVLTGEGSDEILAGYHASTPTPAGPSAAGDASQPPGWVRGNVANARTHRGLLRAEFAAEFAGEDVYARLLAELDVAGQLAGRTRIDQELYLWTKTVLPNYILTVGGDRTEMAHSVEGRLPFLDQAVFAVARPLPPAAKLRKPVKSALRSAVRPLITEAVHQGRKQPFQAPPSTGRAQDPLLERVAEILARPALERLPFFEPARLRALVAELPGLDRMRRLVVDPWIMAAASLCVLQERFAP